MSHLVGFSIFTFVWSRPFFPNTKVYNFYKRPQLNFNLSRSIFPFFFCCVSVSFSLILHSSLNFLCLKVKQFHYRPGQALRVSEGGGSQISRQSTHEGGKVVSPTHQPSLPPQEIFLLLISVRGRFSPRTTLWQEGFLSLKNSQCHHRESNPRPSDFMRSSSNNYSTACPNILYLTFS